MAHNLLDLLEGDDDLTGQGPCEFCGDSFPFDLLIEHQSGCRPDLLHFANENASIPALKASDLKMVLPKIKTEKQKTSYGIAKNLTSNADLTENVSLLSSQTKTIERKTVSERKKEMKVEQVTLEDPTMKEIGRSKIMVYGTKNEEVEEKEKKSFKFPSIPLFNNADQTKDKAIESDLLSDNESGESLEEFWRRAEVVLNQRKMKRR